MSVRIDNNTLEVFGPDNEYLGCVGFGGGLYDTPWYFRPKGSTESIRVPRALVATESLELVGEWIDHLRSAL